jgi:hypothetical protein
MLAAILMLGDNFAAIASLVNLGVTIFGGFGFLLTVRSHQAVQDILLENLSKTVERLDKTIEELRRGDGWIQKPPHQHVDREY